ncbi:hypothetical protein PHLCEN_2v4942 [Hermanssonia centrifuga]|uniref:Terpene synthase n=1 Tax=Hermanssonia centrifuga TaxID=98765 RepID=A0A2R6PCD4_9APHY|nr:hypothetical protein PHLCEN_2v4942 [Hermanssonia centrifuga]
MPSTIRSYVLPDLHALCAWKSGFNPHHAEARAASQKWVLGFKAFSGKKLEFFSQGGSELLCSYVYWYAGLEQLRTACDFVNLLFTIDEISDEQNGEDAVKTGEIVLNTLLDEAYNDGSMLCRMTKDFRARFFPHTGPATLRRFLKHTEAYVHGFGREAELREAGVVLDVESYNVLRRENSAVRYCFGLFGFLLGLDLPDEIFEHPIMMEMHLAAVDMVTWSNDLYSYNMEQAMGHLTNNVLTVLMKEKNTDLQGAANLVGEHFKNLSDKFEALRLALPSFGEEMDYVVSKYIMAMQSWVSGNLDWSFATLRYFGADHMKVKETLVVQLYPTRK